MHMVGPDRLHGFGQRLLDDKNEWVDLRQGPVRTPQARRGSNSHVTECGPGPLRWLEYDGAVTDLSERFLRDKADNPADRPWCLVASFMYPHFPLYAPQEYIDLYPQDRIDLPDLGEESLESQHPAIRQLRYFFRNDLPFSEELTRTALASYFALVTLTDEHIGRLTSIVDETPLGENTVIIYLSDHGEMAGQHGIWQKQCFYESSVRVPLIFRGPPPGVGRPAPTSTSAWSTLCPLCLTWQVRPSPDGLRGRSLLPVLRGGALPEQAVIAEYHAQGMISAGYMAKKGDLKYNYYVDFPPQLFNLAADPNEFVDLAGHSGWAGAQSDLHQELLARLDPEEVDGRAKRNQQLQGMARSYAG